MPQIQSLFTASLLVVFYLTEIPIVFAAPAPVPNGYEYQVICECSSPKGVFLRPGFRSLEGGWATRRNEPVWAKFLEPSMTPLKGNNDKGFKNLSEAIDAAKNLPLEREDENLGKAPTCEGVNLRLFDTLELRVSDLDRFDKDPRAMPAVTLPATTAWSDRRFFGYKLADESPIPVLLKGNVLACKIVRIRNGAITGLFTADGKIIEAKNETDLIPHKRNNQGHSRIGVK